MTVIGWWAVSLSIFFSVMGFIIWKIEMKNVNPN